MVGSPTRSGVLYVEDDQTNRALMVKIFERYLSDVKLEAVSSGVEALESVKANNPRLILMDGQLADTTAPELVSKLRECIPPPLPPIAVVSGSMRPDTACAVEGVVAHVLKPFVIPDLVALIVRLLDEGSSDAE